MNGHQPANVLIDVLSQSNSSVNESFASTVIKERLNEDGRLELEVPDAIVGAVLGPKAKTLVEIQSHSGCKVEVHKRGTGNPSSGHRLITYVCCLFSFSFYLVIISHVNFFLG